MPNPTPRDSIVTARHTFRLRLANLCDWLTAHEIRYTIASRDRTPQQQHALFARGRTAPGKKCTNADYYQSAHVWGLACDFLLVDNPGKTLSSKAPQWAQFAALAKQCSLVCGGSWRRLKDSGHVELPDWHTHINWPASSKPRARITR